MNEKAKRDQLKRGNDAPTTMMMMTTTTTTIATTITDEMKERIINKFYRM